MLNRLTRCTGGPKSKSRSRAFRVDQAQRAFLTRACVVSTQGMDRLLPTHRDLLARYDHRRDTRPAPLFDAFLLADVVDHLPYLTMLTPDPASSLGFRFIVMGSEVVRLAGRDYSGLAVEASLHPSERSSETRLLEQLRADCRPQVIRGQWRRPEASDDVLERLFLPCLDAQGVLGTVLVSVRPFPVGLARSPAVMEHS